MGVGSKEGTRGYGSEGKARNSSIVRRKSRIQLTDEEIIKLVKYLLKKPVLSMKNNK